MFYTSLGELSGMGAELLLKFHTGEKNRPRYTIQTHGDIDMVLALLGPDDYTKQIRYSVTRPYGTSTSTVEPQLYRPYGTSTVEPQLYRPYGTSISTVEPQLYRPYGTSTSVVEPQLYRPYGTSTSTVEPQLYRPSTSTVEP